jgi:hypothetical protein
MNGLFLTLALRQDNLALKGVFERFQLKLTKVWDRIGAIGYPVGAGRNIGLDNNILYPKVVI